MIANGPSVEEGSRVDVAVEGGAPIARQHQS